MADFDRYIEEHGILDEHFRAAFAIWIAEKTGRPVPRFREGRRTRGRVAA
jgi:hypothetical protein